MSDGISQFLSFFEKNKELVFIIPAYIAIVSAIILSRNFRKTFFSFTEAVFEAVYSMIKGKFLYSEGSDFELKEKHIAAIVRSEILKIKDELRDDLLVNRTQLIDDEIDDYVNTRLKNKIEDKFNNIETVDNKLIDKLNEYATNKIETFISEVDLAPIASSIADIKRAEQAMLSNKKLSYILQHQMDNTGRIKTVMINLFIIVNIAIMAFYLLGNVSNLPSSAIYGITGLYISLATFIFYIYRSSNFRSSVVMAIKEDSKKLNDVLDYLSKYKNGKELNEYDIELLKMILINRAEREKMAAHPYEMVFKGISESNIQIKGGNIGLSKAASKAKE